MTDLTFKISAVSENPTKTISKARGFEIIIDEPNNLGGTNEGMNPVEVLLSALAGCLNVAAHLVAGEMGLELKGLKIDIEGDLNPLRFMGKSYDQRAGYKAVRVKLKPDCDFDDATKQKWIEEIERRCPVSDNIANETPVEISYE